MSKGKPNDPRYQKYDFVSTSELKEFTRFLPQIASSIAFLTQSNNQSNTSKAPLPSKFEIKTEGMLFHNDPSSENSLLTKQPTSPYYHIKKTYSPKTEQYTSHSYNFGKKVSVNSLSNNNNSTLGDSIMQWSRHSQIRNPNARNINRRNYSLNDSVIDFSNQELQHGPKEIFQLTSDNNSQAYLKYCNVNELDKQMRLEHIKKSLYLDKQKSFKSLFKAIIPQKSHEFQDFSMQRGVDWKRNVPNGFKIGVNQHNKGFQISDISKDNDYLLRKSLPKEHMMLPVESKINRYNNISNESIDYSVIEANATAICEENHMHNSLANDTTFEKYYKKSKPANIAAKHKKLLSSLEEKSKVRLETKQSGLDASSRLPSLAKIQKKNQQTMEKATLEKLRRSKAILEFANNALNEQIARENRFVKKVVDEFSFKPEHQPGNPKSSKNS